MSARVTTDNGAFAEGEAYEGSSSGMATGGFSIDGEDDEISESRPLVRAIPGSNFMMILSGFEAPDINRYCRRALQAATVNAAWAILHNVIDIILVFALLTFKSDHGMVILNFFITVAIAALILYMGILGVRSKNASIVTGGPIKAGAKGMMRMGHLHGYLAGVVLLTLLYVFELTLTSMYLVKSADCGECWVDKEDPEIECNTTQVYTYSNITGETQLEDNPMECVRSVFAWIGYLYVAFSVIQLGMLAICARRMQQLLKILQRQSDASVT